MSETNPDGNPENTDKTKTEDGDQGPVVDDANTKGGNSEGEVDDKSKRVTDGLNDVLLILTGFKPKEEPVDIESAKKGVEDFCASYEQTLKDAAASAAAPAAAPAAPAPAPAAAEVAEGEVANPDAAKSGGRRRSKRRQPRRSAKQSKKGGRSRKNHRKQSRRRKH